CTSEQCFYDYTTKKCESGAFHDCPDNGGCIETSPQHCQCKTGCNYDYQTGTCHAFHVDVCGSDKECGMKNGKCTCVKK
ncbi:hypothetical protein KIPB_011361, partial [Kipferlia bialata]